MNAASVILSGVLVVITGIYAWITWLIARKSSESADAARLAALASQSAAEAALRSAQVAEATLPLRLRMKVDRHFDGEVWITLKVRGASVWVHAARITGGIIKFHEDGQAVRTILPTELLRARADEFESFPFLATQGGGGHSLEWPDSPLRLTDWGCGIFAEIDYSLSRNSEVMTRRVTTELPADFYHRENKRHGYMPDMLNPSEKPADEDVTDD